MWVWGLQRTFQFSSGAAVSLHTHTHYEHIFILFPMLTMQQSGKSISKGLILQFPVWPSHQQCFGFGEVQEAEVEAVLHRQFVMIQSQHCTHVLVYSVDCCVNKVDLIYITTGLQAEASLCLTGATKYIKLLIWNWPVMTKKLGKSLCTNSAMVLQKADPGHVMTACHGNWAKKKTETKTVKNWERLTTEAWMSLDKVLNYGFQWPGTVYFGKVWHRLRPWQLNCG